MDPIKIGWICCIVLNIFFIAIDVLLIEKKFELTVGELCLFLLFMIIGAPIGTLIYIMAFFGRYHDKTIIQWSKKEK